MMDLHQMLGERGRRFGTPANDYIFLVEDGEGYNFLDILNLTEAQAINAAEVMARFEGKKVIYAVYAGVANPK